MVTIHSAHASIRRAGLLLSLLAAIALTACGSTGTPGASSGTPAPTPTPTPLSTPGPSSVQATITGDARVTGPLVTANVHFVNCEGPSLQGPTILAFRNATDTAIGVLLSIRQGSISVRLAEGASTAYTERTFDGTGVTAFDAASGARFSSSLTESTPATDHKGTIGTVSSISGSVSCGTFTPGSASLTIAGNTAGGAVNGSPTKVRVLCGTQSTGQYYAQVSGLIQVGSTPAVVSISGGTQQSPLFVFLQTASAAYGYSTSTPQGVSVTATNATYNGTVMETSPVAGAHTLTVSGSATCGTSS
jgi:hypothetical protein